MIILLVITIALIIIGALRSKPNQELIENKWFILAFVFGASLFLNVIISIIK